MPRRNFYWSLNDPSIHGCHTLAHKPLLRNKNTPRRAFWNVPSDDDIRVEGYNRWTHKNYLAPVVLRKHTMRQARAS
jgi:hypothetical protein